MKDINYEEIYHAIKEAGRVILDVYATDFDVAMKGEDEPVTKADIDANKVITEALWHYGYPIMSEEGMDDQARFDSGYVWIVDPLDGTGDFVRKTGEFCSMVALLKDNEPIFCVIYLPTNDTLYYAHKGEGAYVRTADGNKKLKVSDVHAVEHATAVVSRTHTDEALRGLVGTIQPKDSIPVGSNGVKAAMVAEGAVEFFINGTHKMGEWDIAAPQLLVEEAGGRVTGAFGEELTYNKKDPHAEFGIFASNGLLHDAILSRIQ